jgi:glutamate 5-kinase
MPAPSTPCVPARACCPLALLPWKATSAAGQEIARGLSNYGSGESRLIARKSTGEIEELLGYVDEPEIIHRDNLILIG